MNALGASDLVRTICATAGTPAATDARRLARGRPGRVAARPLHRSSGAGTRCRPRRISGVSCSRRARGRPPGRRRPVPQPHGPRRRRAPAARCPGTDAALAMGMMRAIVDAELQDEELCRAHTDGYDEMLAGWTSYPVDRCAAICGVPADVDRRRRPRRSPPRGRPCCGSASAPSATAARRSPTARSRACRRSRAPGATAAAAVVLPAGDGRRTSTAARSLAPTCARGPVRASTWRSWAGADRPGARPAGQGAGRLELEPAPIAPDQDAGARGACAATTCSPSCSSSS